MKKLSIALALFILAFNLNVSAQLKGDPWIFQVYKEVYNRQPTAWELNIQNYNAGSWGNYNELKNYIKEYQAAVSSQNITIVTTSLSSGKVGVLFNQGGKPLAVNLISQDGGGLVASGGGNLRLPAADVSKLVASGGGNLVASGGGNLVASGGGNLAGVNFGGNYGTLAAGIKRIPVSGKGAWIIK